MPGLQLFAQEQPVVCATRRTRQFYTDLLPSRVGGNLNQTEWKTDDKRLGLGLVPTSTPVARANANPVQAKVVPRRSERERVIALDPLNKTVIYSPVLSYCPATDRIQCARAGPDPESLLCCGCEKVEESVEQLIRAEGSVNVPMEK